MALAGLFSRRTFFKEAGEGAAGLLLADAAGVVTPAHAAAGGGPNWTPTTGRPTDNLRSAGYEPEDVDKVKLNHGHPDHIWGRIDGFEEAPRAIISLRQSGTSGPPMRRQRVLLMPSRVLLSVPRSTCRHLLTGRRG